MSQTNNPFFKTSIFWKLCCVYDHIVVHTLIRYCSTTSNEFWDALRDILDASGILYSVLADELREEVMNTKPHTLFRVNSGPTSLLSSVFRKEMASLMERHVNPIIHSCNTDDIQLDSPDEHVRTKSIDTVTKYINIHITRFQQMASEIPENLRSIFGIVRDTVDEIFPDSGVSTQILSALFFHKIITPAIITPTKFCSSISTPTDKGRQTLMLLSKIYQTFVNQSDEPFPKEINLHVFNDAIVSEYKRVHDMLDLLSSSTTLPEYHFNKVVSSQLLLRRVPPIITSLESLKPAAVSAIIQPFIDTGFKNLAENLLALTNINIYQKDLAKLDLKKPKDVGIFYDESEELCYTAVIRGYEDTVNMYQKKINKLTEEIFKLNQVIERLDAPIEPKSLVNMNTSPSLTPRKEEKESTKTVNIQEFYISEKIPDEIRCRLITLTSKENQIYDFITKSESTTVLGKCEKFLGVYQKASKCKIEDDAPKISQKDKDKEIKDKDKKDKEKAVAKNKKTCLGILKEAHDNREALMSHLEDTKLTQRIVALTGILDDIIFIFN
ncbi:hypothetical protein EIN_093390 [Entamoeba invadens IP1]|uniref:Ras-GAP domain-containing protein n=1 Tax=Entamoeba invadens IP1 TaxID=370355 RepID=A0A0A1TZW6_ENTIV|nr:hypothetical protein EIN_093390 [Entamoeba invadens IP1]ELP87182.1 hypothetical protein EIN_093390 [Entamoeba invadens IP1]|eukprot:XP_004253953.1 hypothetical protein EIN_093390 [Entamoeba invadens IP1]